MRVNGRSISGPTVVLLIGVLMLIGCSGTAPSETEAGPTAGKSFGSSVAPLARLQTSELRVMTFNIEYGGVGVDFASVSRAIKAAHADVVAINEGYGNIPRLSADLDWRYFDIRSQIVSRFPLLTPPGSDALRLRRGARTTDGRAVLVEVAPRRVVAIVNVHLPSSPYSPFKVQNGASAHEILGIEKRVRVPALRLPLRTAEGLIADHVPVFLLGDFNSPSDLDWTKATVGLRPQIRYPLRWPASVAVEASGMVDSYRAVHPNPVTDQGLTWPASRPFVKGYNPGPNGAAADRIDLLFSGGPARAIHSSIVGEAGNKYSDIVVSPWPTDHRAVVSQFKVKPAPTTTLVSVRSRLLTRGAPLIVDYSASDANADSLVITPATCAGDPVIRDPVNHAVGGTERIDTTSLKPAAYEACLLDEDGRLLAQMAFWVKAKAAKPRLETSKRSYDRGEAIRVSWTDAPGNRNDWLGVFHNDGKPGLGSYVGWTYVGAEIAGSTLLDGRINGVNWPLPKGRYTVSLLKDDGYAVLAHADFVIR
jgi:endonuclease/exonuclease/phosphatase family metal-dependent hydrolase